MDFVSPENVGECIHLTEEFRRLPSNHWAKEDKLEVIHHYLSSTSSRRLMSDHVFVLSGTYCLCGCLITFL